MIGSRTFNIIQTISRNVTSKSPKNTLQLQQIRHSGHGPWNYRSYSPPPKWAERGADYCGVMVWWWFWWNMYHGWGHIIGKYGDRYVPDPLTFTDEELGIPPDDEDI